jgi:hypothetical protein
MKESLAETPRTYEFRYGTSYRSRGGVEWAIVAKSMKELEIAWDLTASNTVPFDPSKANEVRIKRP